MWMIFGKKLIKIYFERFIKLQKNWNPLYFGKVSYEWNFIMKTLFILFNCLPFFSHKKMLKKLTWKTFELDLIHIDFYIFDYKKIDKIAVLITHLYL